VHGERAPRVHPPHYSTPHWEQSQGFPTLGTASNSHATSPPLMMNSRYPPPERRHRKAAAGTSLLAGGVWRIASVQTELDSEK
jgi:hypothetical protein